MIKHILFDNDGTLVDSEIIAVRSMLRLMARHGIHMNEREYCLRFPGLRMHDILAILHREHGIEFPADTLSELRQEHIERFKHELRAIPGMPKLFKQLKTPKSVVSNGSAGHVERSLRKVRLMHALDGRIFSAEHVQRPKPHPDVYLYAVDVLALRPAEVLVVEDSPTGVMAAKSAGLQVVGFLGATHIHDGHDDTLLHHGADHLAADARSLASILEALKIS